LLSDLPRGLWSLWDQNTPSFDIDFHYKLPHNNHINKKLELSMRTILQELMTALIGTIKFRLI
jgi:hypothetical protein